MITVAASAAHARAHSPDELSAALLVEGLSRCMGTRGRLLIIDEVAADDERVAVRLT